MRIAKDSNVGNETYEIMQELKTHGITAIDWPPGDAYLNEDELIKYLLNHE